MTKRELIAAVSAVEGMNLSIESAAENSCCVELFFQPQSTHADI
jgi:hypothetical protein